MNAEPDGETLDPEAMTVDVAGLSENAARRTRTLVGLRTASTTN
jgi:hypothetical protein